jgi:6-phosphofructokinase 1
MMGCEAVKAAISGVTDKMVAIERISDCDGYRVKPILLNLDVVANAEKKFPLEWITAEGNGISSAFFNYVLPLIEGEPEIKWENGIPRFAKLKKILAK